MIEGCDLSMKDDGGFFVLHLNSPISTEFLIFWIRKAEQRGYTKWQLPTKEGEFRFSK